MTTNNITLVHAKVTVADRDNAMARAKEVVVTLRPDHSCIPSQCEDCFADMLDLAEAKLPKGTLVTAAASVEVLRSRLATSSRSTANEKAAEMQRLADENEAWVSGYGRSRNRAPRQPGQRWPSIRYTARPLAMSGSDQA